MEPNTETKKPSRFTKWSLIVGIIIVLNLFFNYGISLVYKEPAYPVAPQVVGDITTREKCLEVGGQWNENVYPTPAPEQKTMPKGYCDPDYTNRQNYETAHKVYNRNVFIILMILGVVSLMVGIFAGSEVLAVAFSWGGVLSLIIASMRYWSDADNLIKVILLAVALGALVWLALRKFAKS